jgi:hypothetical protein
VVAPFDRYRGALGGREAKAILRELYASLPVADISRHVLAAAGGLRVVQMGDAGWCDCGTPERLFQALQPQAVARLQRRLVGHDGWRVPRSAESPPHRTRAGRHSRRRSSTSYSSPDLVAHRGTIRKLWRRIRQR